MSQRAIPAPKDDIGQSDPDAERFVLSSIFSSFSDNPDCFSHIAETISEESFSIEKHRVIFGAMREVFSRGLAINRQTVWNELERASNLERAGMWISELALEPVSVVNLDTFCKVVSEKYRLRRLQASTVAIQGRIAQGDASEEIISDAQRALMKIEESISQDEGLDPEEIIQEAGGINYFLSPERESGIMTPWQRLNRFTNGLREGQLVAIGAKPGVGKTSLACNMALHAASNGHRVRIESHEMLPPELLFRMACSHANVDSQEVRAGRLHSDQRDDLQSAIAEILDYKQYLNISRKPIKTTAGIAAYLRRQKAKGTPIKTLIVDYLQKMHGIGKFERREQEVAQIAVGLKEISLDFALPVVALAQLNVDAREQFNHPPTVDDFRESKAIGQEADLAIILRLNDAEQLYQPSRLVNAYLVKQRNGRTGKIPFYFHAKYTRYEELPEELREVA